MDLNAVQMLAVEYAIVCMGIYLTLKSAFLRKDNMRYFLGFLVITDVFAIINVPIRCVELHLVQWNRTFVFWLYALSIILMTFTMVSWSVFVLRQQNNRLINTSTKLGLWILPSFLIIPLCITNYWTGWLYVIDESSWYNRGSHFILQALISYIYLLAMVFTQVQFAIVEKNKKVVKRFIVASLPVLVGAALQIFFGGSYLLLGIVFCGWTMYVNIGLNRQKAYELSEAVSSINDELIHSNMQIADDMRTILALSNIYHTLYEVDLEKDTFKIIKALKVVADFSAKYTSARECMKALPQELFDEGYVAVMNLMFDPDTLEERLKDKNSYYTDARGYFSKDWIRSTLLVTERNAEGKVTKLVFTFQEIGYIVEQRKQLEEASIYEMHAKEMKELFLETTESLAGAIDAKDKYTRGHSFRVAMYARQIAEAAGKSEAECEQVYFAGLLHDVGKIGITESILCKEGRLTDDEYSVIKTHPVLGNDILQKINRMPYLSVGAHYHHERYDGKGYPQGLKGEEIPELARIIAVADAYDAMTSKRSYRNTIPQQTVREELVKGIETQFDPNFAMIMIHLIDLDIEYQMQEHIEFDTDEEKKDLFIEEYRSAYSSGLRVTDYKSNLHFKFKETAADGMPAIVFYDALDARVHKGDAFEKTLSYHEYGEIKADGTYTFDGVRKTSVDIEEVTEAVGNDFDIDIVKDGDHVYFEMTALGKKHKMTLALPDNTRFFYLAITGENCDISEIETKINDEPIQAGEIKRIADEITYLSGVQGDIPSIQVDGWRSATSNGISVSDNTELTFDMKSLPFARLIWHCPFIVLYHSKDGLIDGEDYREYAVIRLNGEGWSGDGGISCSVSVKKTEEFKGWEQWKEENKAGRHCQVSAKLIGDSVILKTTNGGLEIESTTKVDIDKKIYLALTGDECVIENIRC